MDPVLSSLPMLQASTNGLPEMVLMAENAPAQRWNRKKSPSGSSESPTSERGTRETTTPDAETREKEKRDLEKRRNWIRLRC